MLLIFTNYNELATCSGCLDPTGAVSEACVNETHTGGGTGGISTTVGRQCKSAAVT